MQDILNELEHQMTKLRKDIEHHKKSAAKSMQAAFTLGQASHVLGKFIMDDALFPPKQKDAVYRKHDTSGCCAGSPPSISEPRIPALSRIRESELVA